ncbi:MAG: transposase [Caldilineales bacterium]|nr:transposase [Caldilineales bacterium]
MHILPISVRLAILSHFTELLLWLSDLVYSQVLREDEFLLKVEGVLDWKALETVVAGYHHHSGPGAHPTHSSAQLLRALIAKYLLDLSLRQVEHEIRYNLVVKHFCGYRLFDLGPDHSTLERFEQWVELHHHRDLFDDVLRQIDLAFPDDRQQAQIADTFALRTNAAPQSVIALLRQCAHYLLRTLAAIDLPAQAELLRQLDPDQHDALFGRQNELPEHRLDPEQRRLRLQATLACQQLLALVRTWLAQSTTSATTPTSPSHPTSFVKSGPTPAPNPTPSPFLRLRSGQAPTSSAPKKNTTTSSPPKSSTTRPLAPANTSPRSNA